MTTQDTVGRVEPTGQFVIPLRLIWIVGGILAAMILIVAVVVLVLLRPNRFAQGNPISAGPAALVLHLSDAAPGYVQNPKSGSDAFGYFPGLPGDGHINGYEILLNPAGGGGPVISWANKYVDEGAATRAMSGVEMSFRKGQFIVLNTGYSFPSSAVKVSSPNDPLLGTDAISALAADHRAVVWRVHNVIEMVDVVGLPELDPIHLAETQSQRAGQP